MLTFAWQLYWSSFPCRAYLWKQVSLQALLALHLCFPYHLAHYGNVNRPGMLLAQFLFFAAFLSWIAWPQWKFFLGSLLMVLLGGCVLSVAFLAVGA